MKFRRLSILFTLVLMLGAFFSPNTFAIANVKPNLVALGDSITYGSNLNPGEKPFPSLIKEGEFEVTNLGKPGWTSSELLTAVQSKGEFISAVKDANVVTLNIGGNDLLQAAGVSKEVLTGQAPINVDQAKVQAAISKLSENVTLIVGEILKLNSEAPIILYTLYNPFGPSEDPFKNSLHLAGESFIPAANETIRFIDNMPNVGIYLADAYTAFNGKQAEYISNDFIHPNAEGQKLLANLAAAVLPEINSFAINLTASQKEETGPVTITVATNAKAVQAMKWLEGDKAVKDFADGAGTPIVNNQFEVTKNGTYTVYVLADNGCKCGVKEKVKSITITSIKPVDPVDPPVDPVDPPVDPVDPPVDPVDPPVDPVDPPVDPVDPVNPKPTPTTPAAPVVPIKTVPVKNVKGNALPNTATPAYNYIAIGAAVAISGLAAMAIAKRRRQEV